jgi:shikimate 5-dehydrogenase
MTTTPLTAALRPTMYFVGVSTMSSSIMRVFPRWARLLDLGDCELKGIDLAVRAPAAEFRALVEFIKNDPNSLGALVTTHKLDIVEAAGDLIDEYDPLAAALREISCLSKSVGRFVGHAKDPVSSGLALAAITPDGHWKRKRGEAFVIGAGGAALAIVCSLAGAAHGDDRPSRIHVSDRDPTRLAHFRATAERLELGLPLNLLEAGSAADNSATLAKLPPHSLVVNASGLGKDAPGSPLPDGARFPLDSFAWDLNYRGDLKFLAQARAAIAARRLRVEDGWLYFLHGWTRAIAEVFHIDIPTKGPAFDLLSQEAAGARG